MKNGLKNLLQKKYFIPLLIAQMLVLLFLGRNVFEGEQCVFSVSGRNLRGEALETEEGVAYRTENMALKPGVYRVRVQSPAGEDESLFLEMRCEDSRFRALLGNGVHLFPMQKETQFEFYVTSRIDSAYLYCEFMGCDRESLGEAAVYRTSAGWRILWVIAAFGFVMLDLLIVLREGILSGDIDETKRLVLFGLAGSAVLSYLPWLTDYFSLGADTAVHLQRVEGLKNTLLLNPALPIRVHNTWVFGHGYMAPVFYGDLFLLLPAALRLIGFPMMSAYKIFVFAVTVLTAVIAYVSLKRCTGDAKAALFGALLYVLAPYRMYNVYNRGALGEFLAMAFMPLVCCGMYLLLTQDENEPAYKNHKWYLVIGMSEILQSHLLSTEMTACFLAIICLICIKKVLRRRTFGELFKAAGLVLLLNCWYWFPMLYLLGAEEFRVEGVFEGKIQRLGVGLERFFQWVPNVGSTHVGVYQGEPIQLGIGATILLIWCAGGCLRRKDKVRKSPQTVFVLLLFIALFMSTKYFPWDFLGNVPGIRFFATSLQFPTRLMAPAAVFAAFLAAFCYHGTPKKLLFGIVAVSAVVSALYHTNSILSHAKPTYLYTAENMGTTSVGQGEYLLKDTWVQDYFYHEPQAGEGISFCDYVKKGTEIVLFAKNASASEGYLDLPLIGYPGYAVEEAAAFGMQKSDGGPYLAKERGAHGDLRVVIPGGYEGNIRIFYKGLPVFGAADMVSAISILGVLLYGIWRGKTRWFGKENPSAETEKGI